MKQEHHDIERWAQRLAGKTSGRDADPQLDALRAVIEASDRSVSEITATDQLAHARLIARLEKEGLLGKPRARWQLLAAAAAVLIAAVGLRIALPPDTVERGIAGSVTIVTERPDATLAQVMQQLVLLGLQPRSVSEAGRVFVEVSVSRERLEAFYQWAQGHGGRPLAAGKYRIFIDATIGDTP